MFLPPIKKVCANNKLNPDRYIGYIDYLYSSNLHTFSPRISRDTGSLVKKNTKKIRIFDYM